MALIRKTDLLSLRKYLLSQNEGIYENSILITPQPYMETNGILLQAIY